MRSDGDVDQAEMYFRKGLEVAREQNAKSLELRLHLSMFELYQSGPNARKCGSRLAKIYKTFHEGFDTPDLIRAKAATGNA